MNRVDTPVAFRRTSDAREPWAAVVNGVCWRIRINEFPEESTLYTLLVEGEAPLDVMEWPAAWTRDDDAPHNDAPADDPMERSEYEREIAHAERVCGIPPSKLVP